MRQCAETGNCQRGAALDSCKAQSRREQVWCWNPATQGESVYYYFHGMLMLNIVVFWFFAFSLYLGGYSFCGQILDLPTQRLPHGIFKAVHAWYVSVFFLDP